jgi:signal transduction histidine kinase
MNDNSSSPDTILVVDDMPDNAKVLLEFFKLKGFKVLIAEDGKEALQMTEQVHPDLILLDVMMPGMDGFEVCQRLKSNENTREIPILFITALVDTVDKLKGFDLGAADYITKPFQYKEVLARVNAHLSLRKLQRQLQTQNQQLQKRNMELDAFAHTVAHDLKNPLSAVMALSNMLANSCSTDTLPDANFIDRLQLVEQAGQQAVNIVDALLLLAGVSRRGTVTHQPLNMSRIVNKVIQQRLALLIKHHKATIDLPENWPVVQSYGPWIEEIWINYLSNGLKYGGKPPHLELGAFVPHSGMIRFWVRDNGLGLTEEEQAQLFTPFTRLHTTRVEGHGLGLSIVQQIVEKLGGQVGVESTKGQGSLFYFTLPA